MAKDALNKVLITRGHDTAALTDTVDSHLWWLIVVFLSHCWRRRRPAPLMCPQATHTGVGGLANGVLAAPGGIASCPIPHTALPASIGLHACPSMRALLVLTRWTCVHHSPAHIHMTRLPPTTTLQAGNNALHCAALSGNADAVRIVLSAAVPNVPNKASPRPAHTHTHTHTHAMFSLCSLTHTYISHVHGRHASVCLKAPSVRACPGLSVGAAAVPLLLLPAVTDPCPAPSGCLHCRTSQALRSPYTCPSPAGYRVVPYARAHTHTHTHTHTRTGVVHAAARGGHVQHGGGGAGAAGRRRRHGGGGRGGPYAPAPRRARGQCGHHTGAAGGRSEQGGTQQGGWVWGQPPPC